MAACSYTALPRPQARSSLLYVWLDRPLCSSPKCQEALQEFRSRGVPLDLVTVSSDAYGSLPVFDSTGRLVAYDVAEPGGACRRGAACGRPGGRLRC